MFSESNKKIGKKGAGILENCRAKQPWMGEVKGIWRTLNSWVQDKSQKIYFVMCILTLPCVWIL